MRSPVRYITERLGFEKKLRESNDRVVVDAVRTGIGITAFIGWASTGLAVAYTARETWSIDAHMVHTISGDVMQSGIDATNIGRGVLAVVGIAAVAAESSRFFTVSSNVLSELPPEEARIEDY